MSQGPTLLIVDASTRHLQVGVWRDGALAGQWTALGKLTASQVLLPQAQQLLAQQGLTPHDLDGVVTPNGPGLFTGLKIAITTAVTLAGSLDAPLLMPPTLHTLALNAWPTEQTVVAVLDARKRQVFWSAYRVSTEDAQPKVHELRPVASSTPAEVLAALPEAPCLLLGEGLAVHGVAFRESIPAHVTLTPTPLWRPRLEWLGWQGATMLARGETTDPLHVRPFYGRESDAELGNPGQLTSSEKAS